MKSHRRTSCRQYSHPLLLQQNHKFTFLIVSPFSPSNNDISNICFSNYFTTSIFFIRHIFNTKNVDIFFNFYTTCHGYSLEALFSRKNKNLLILLYIIIYYIDKHYYSRKENFDKTQTLIFILFCVLCFIGQHLQTQKIR